MRVLAVIAALLIVATIGWTVFIARESLPIVLAVSSLSVSVLVVADVLSERTR